MSEEEMKALVEIINNKIDLIEMNVARINKNDYFGLDIELLKYIRGLEQKIDKLKEYCFGKLTDIPFTEDDRIRDEYSHRLSRYMNDLLRILNEGGKE